MSVKEKIYHELYLFALYASFIATFFCILTTYRGLILNEPFGYFHYTSAIIQALILSKIILVGESLKLGEKLGKRSLPLIIPTLYKTLIFCCFVLIFTIIEHFIFGFLKKQNMQEIYTELIDKGLDLILAKILVVAFVFFLFFAFLEIAAVLGGNKLLKLFFSRKNEI